jgi:GNAT superfamily N-acetyltransferase
MTIALRRPRKSDAAWLDSWLPAIAQKVGFEVVDAAQLLADRTSNVAIIARSGEPVGTIVWSSEGTRATIRLVALDPAHTRRGTGMQAAAMLEQQLRRRGVRAIDAATSESHGISIYFWIRLGYRPLMRGEWPCERDGVVWMRRDLPAAQTNGSQSRIVLKTSVPK